MPCTAPSSRGLGRRPLKAVTPVRIRSGLLITREGPDDRPVPGVSSPPDMTSARLGTHPAQGSVVADREGGAKMIEPDIESSGAALAEAARELQAASHDAQVAFDCIALGELDRAHTHALTARVAADAAVTALAAALTQPNQDQPNQGQPNPRPAKPGPAHARPAKPRPAGPGRHDDARFSVSDRGRAVPRRTRRSACPGRRGGPRESSGRSARWRHACALDDRCRERCRTRPHHR